MLELAGQVLSWFAQGRDAAIATVAAVSGSAPRQPGSALAVDDEGTVVGSVSGGCVEGTVYELCRQALVDGTPVLERFGYSDDDAFAVGLTCGGLIDILVTPIRADSTERAVYAAALTAADAGEAIALARVVDGPTAMIGRALLVRPDGSHEGGLSADPRLDSAVAAQARALLNAGRTVTITLGADGSYCGRPVTLLVESSIPAPRMIVFGAVEFTAALVRIGKFLGYHVTVCDARPIFATRARFPEADEVVVDWPHRYLAKTAVDERTVLCVLTHDAKFDIPLLQLALRLPVAYIGALGSRRTHHQRHEHLLAAGVADRELGRLHSPIGLDLGGRTAEETALAIAAEIVATRHGGTGRPLIGGHTPIHHDGPITLRKEPSVRIAGLAG